MAGYHITAKMGGLKRKYKYSRDKLIKKSIRCRSYKNFVVHTFLILHGKEPGKLLAKIYESTYTIVRI